ncbi:GspH/FimT family pseudopilin [Phycisphaera mikurensis]|uniref:Type II secretion system protein H n=1 Tax=Phycisphaera mikurensis (strain NBRC 102666 / KCTC 22515 / FYK2301M01) TaxID=1142394 RepID=I0IEA5_PHYMF|nr:GspH/FimT family pseudopilin [Phycisphaera mikurensis]MBB6441395.1 type II secretion system protein H [Phycisphaera mikurensis]BAM03593.1 putative fimbrial protein [Phycisphaera mikurensis NBRC 102666]
MPRRNAPRSAAASRGGFTLIEILIVVLIVGIAGALVVPSMLSAGTIGLQGAARLIVADLQYAQNEAVASGAVRGIEFDPAANRYRMFDENDATIDLKWMRVGGRADTVPGDGTGHTVDFSTDPRFKGFDLRRTRTDGLDPGQLPFRVTFDELGAPTSGSANAIIHIAFAENAYRIEVDGFTGRVTVQ